MGILFVPPRSVWTCVHDRDNVNASVKGRWGLDVHLNRIILCYVKDKSLSSAEVTTAYGSFAVAVSPVQRSLFSYS